MKVFNLIIVIEVDDDEVTDDNHILNLLSNMENLVALAGYSIYDQRVEEEEV